MFWKMYVARKKTKIAKFVTQDPRLRLKYILEAKLRHLKSQNKLTINQLNQHLSEYKSQIQNTNINENDLSVLRLDNINHTIFDASSSSQMPNEQIEPPNISYDSNILIPEVNLFYDSLIEMKSNNMNTSSHINTSLAAWQVQMNNQSYSSMIRNDNLTASRFEGPNDIQVSAQNSVATEATQEGQDTVNKPCETYFGIRSLYNLNQSNMEIDDVSLMENPVCQIQNENNKNGTHESNDLETSTKIDSLSNFSINLQSNRTKTSTPMPMIQMFNGENPPSEIKLINYYCSSECSEANMITPMGIDIVKEIIECSKLLEDDGDFEDGQNSNDVAGISEDMEHNSTAKYKQTIREIVMQNESADRKNNTVNDTQTSSSTLQQTVNHYELEESTIEATQYSDTNSVDPVINRTNSKYEEHTIVNDVQINASYPEMEKEDSHNDKQLILQNSFLHLQYLTPVVNIIQPNNNSSASSWDNREHGHKNFICQSMENRFNENFNISTINCNNNTIPISEHNSVINRIDETEDINESRFTYSPLAERLTLTEDRDTQINALEPELVTTEVLKKNEEIEETHNDQNENSESLPESNYFKEELITQVNKNNPKTDQYLTKINYLENEPEISSNTNFEPHEKQLENIDKCHCVVVLNKTDNKDIQSNVEELETHSKQIFSNDEYENAVVRCIEKQRTKTTQCKKNKKTLGSKINSINKNSNGSYDVKQNKRFKNNIDAKYIQESSIDCNKTNIHSLKELMKKTPAYLDLDATDASVTSISSASKKRNLDNGTTCTSSTDDNNIIRNSVDDDKQITSSTLKESDASDGSAVKLCKLASRKEELLEHTCNSTSGSDKKIKKVKRKKFIPPLKKLTHKEILEEFRNQDRILLERAASTTSESEIRQIYEQRLNRPTFKQIKNATDVVTVRRSNSGCVRVFPGSSSHPLQSRFRKRLGLSRKLQHNRCVNMSIFSDKNADVFEQFIISGNKDYTKFNFNLDGSQAKRNTTGSDNEMIFNFKQSTHVTAEYTRDSISTSLVRHKTNDEMNFTMPSSFFKTLKS